MPTVVPILICNNGTSARCQKPNAFASGFVSLAALERFS